MLLRATSTCFLNTLRDGDLTTYFPEQPVPVFPHIQSKPPLLQLEVIFFCPIPCYLAEETDLHFSTTSFQTGVVKIGPLDPLFLQVKQSQILQLFLIRLELKTLHQLCCPFLDSLQRLNVLPGLKGQELDYHSTL